MHAALRSTNASLKRVHDNTHWFTDHEAWAIFRLGAIGEAVGWTLLIGGIVYKHFHAPGYAIVLSLAGHFHGLLFGIYVVFTLLVSRSLGWGKMRIIVALALSTPPYGSLAFEQYMAWVRRTRPNPQPDPPNID